MVDDELPKAKMLLSFDLFSVPPNEKTADAVVCGTNVEAEFDDLLDVAPNENDESAFGAS